MIQYKYIALDYGGVVAHHYCDPYYAQLSKLLEVSKEQCKQLLSENSTHGAKYRLNEITKFEFWEEVINLAKNKKITPQNYDKLQTLWAQTYIPNYELIDLLKILKNEYKVKLCLATNSDYLRSQYITNNFEFEGVFDLIISSWEYKVLKPTKEYFDALLKVCDATHSPNEILFVENNPSAISQASALGIHTYMYENCNCFKTFLKGL